MNFDSDISLVASVPDAFQTNYAASCTRNFIARALIERIWSSGRFGLQDLSVSMFWTLPETGDETYELSVDAASQYIDLLGIDSSCHLSDEAGPLSLKLKVSLAGAMDGEDYESGVPGPVLGKRCLPCEAVADAGSWVIYIPFDTSEYVLGGSALSRAKALEGLPSPQVSDAAYFVDCYEVVRELVNDGIVISGCTVGKGGLGAALNSFFRSGGEVELGDLSRAAGRPDEESLLFSEVPGALIQIRDADFDYVDAELLLQDVAYYPLGHPSAGLSDLKITTSGKTGIQQILDSLINIE